MPYTYSRGLAGDTTGQPLTGPSISTIPSRPRHTRRPDEYRFGPDLLVAPIMTPGRTATRTVWFPPGRWVGWFDGRTYTGPSTATVTAPLSPMPVFVRAAASCRRPRGVAGRSEPDGAAAHRGTAGPGTSSFSLHTDAGDGPRLRRGAVRRHGAGVLRAPGHWWRPGLQPADVGAATGTFPGAVADRSYAVDVLALSRPDRVRVDGVALASVPPRRGPGWWYDDAARTLHVRTAPLATATAHTVEQRGGEVRD